MFLLDGTASELYPAMCASSLDIEVLGGIRFQLKEVPSKIKNLI